MNNLEGRRARNMRIRLGFLVSLVGMGFGRLVMAAYGLQVERADELRLRAEHQYQRNVGLDPRRGSIFDRNGNPLAVSVPSFTLVAYPNRLAMPQGSTRLRVDLQALAARLGQVTGMPAGEVFERIGNPRTTYSRVRPRLTDAQTLAVRTVLSETSRGLRPGLAANRAAPPLDGIELVEESRRWYPLQEAAAHVVGVVGASGTGLEGLERSLDAQLRGHRIDAPGVRDARGNMVFVDGVRPGEGQAGADVHLTLDATIQTIASRELGLACQMLQARGGSVIVTDPSTGEVMAMANWPTFDPNNLSTVSPDAMRNRAITDRFEPGSTMKIFSVGAALDAGVVRPGQLFNGWGGQWEIGDLTLHDTHVLTWMTPLQVIQVSSNIGAAQIGLALGADGLERAYRRFGFGDATGLPLPGEARARFGGRRWYDVEVATVSFGQGIGVTSAQLAQGLGAVANGGRLVPLLLMSRVTDATGTLLEEHAPASGRPALQPATARLMTEMLTTVTEEGGTGVEASIPGVRVAGKTGTAQKANERRRGYSTDRFVSSFIGFAPAERPRLVVTVVIDEPQDSHAGGLVAAPVFRRIVEQSLRYLGALPGLQRGVVGPLPRPRTPAATTPATRGTPSAEVDEPVAPSGPPAPRLLGLSAREALRRVQPHGLTLALHGSGVITRQEPAPGAPMTAGRPVLVWLEPAGGYTPSPTAAPASVEVLR